MPVTAWWARLRKRAWPTFGTLRVIQAALPFLRQQGSVHILGVSNGKGIVAVPLIAG